MFVATATTVRLCYSRHAKSRANIASAHGSATALGAHMRRAQSRQHKKNIFNHTTSPFNVLILLINQFYGYRTSVYDNDDNALYIDFNTRDVYALLNTISTVYIQKINYRYTRVYVTEHSTNTCFYDLKRFFKTINFVSRFNCKYVK